MRTGVGIGLLLAVLAANAHAQDGYNFSGTDALWDVDLADQTGLSLGDLDALDDQFGGFAIQGSAIQRSITVGAGDSLSFDYNLISEEGMDGDQGANDVAFIAIDGVVTALADTFDLIGGGSSTFSFPLVNGQNPPDETGFLTQTLFFENATTFEFTLGVVDTSDPFVASVLLVDQVEILLSGGGSVVLEDFESGLGDFVAFGDVLVDDGSFGVSPPQGARQALLATTAIPEPATALLLGAGLALLSHRRRSAAPRPDGAAPAGE